VIDFAIDNLHLAGGAQAVTAGVRQINPRTQACIEDGLAILDVDRYAQWLDGQLIRHRLSTGPLKAVETRRLEAQAILVLQAILFKALVEIGRPGLA
jgi:hypothetical protein